MKLTRFAKTAITRRQQVRSEWDASRLQTERVAKAGASGMSWKQPPSATSLPNLHNCEPAHRIIPILRNTQTSAGF